MTPLQRLQDLIRNAHGNLVTVGGMPEFTTLENIRCLRGQRGDHDTGRDYVDAQCPKRGSATWKRAMARVRAALAQAGIVLSSRPIGTGRYSSVFGIDGLPSLVAKVTVDRTEAAAWQWILTQRRRGLGFSDRAAPALAKTFAVVALGFDPLCPLYLIVQQRYAELPSSDQALIEEIAGDDGVWRMRSRPMAAHAKVTALAKRARRVTNKAAKVTDLMRTMQELASHNLVVHDIHGGNLMGDTARAPRRWHITDLGICQAPMAVQVPIWSGPR